MVRYAIRGVIYYLLFYLVARLLISFFSFPVLKNTEKFDFLVTSFLPLAAVSWVVYVLAERFAEEQKRELQQRECGFFIIFWFAFNMLIQLPFLLFSVNWDEAQLRAQKDMELFAAIFSIDTHVGLLYNIFSFSLAIVFALIIFYLFPYFTRKALQRISEEERKEKGVNLEV